MEARADEAGEADAADAAPRTLDARAVSFVRAANIASGAPANQCGREVAPVAAHATAPKRKAKSVSLFDMMMKKQKPKKQKLACYRGAL